MTEFDASNLPPEVIAAGRLIGLLTGSGAHDIGLDSGWFAAPQNGLETMSSRLGSLAALLDATLVASQDGPRVFASATWYQLPTAEPEVPSVLCVVATAADSAGPLPTVGQFGAGMLASTGFGAHDIAISAYLPLVGYDGKGVHAIALTDPIQLRLDVTARPPTPPFSSQPGETFTGITVELAVPLDGGSPTCSLTFCGLQGADDAVYTGLEALLATPGALDRLATVIVDGGQPWLLSYGGNAPAGAGNMPLGAGLDEPLSPPTIGDILCKVGLLAREPPPAQPPAEGAPPSYTSNLTSLSGQSPEQIVLNLLSKSLDTLAGADVALIDLPGGGIYFEKTADGGYGARVAAEIALTDSVDISLGSWMAGEQAGTDWMTAAKVPGDRGVSALFLVPDGETFKFSPSLELNSLGFNLRGPAGAPLVDTDGWTIGGISLRGSLRTEDWRWGAAARIDDFGVPLGGGFDAAQPDPPAGNGVVRTLMASGAAPPAAPPASPVNPAFSAEAAYMKTGRLVVELIDADGQRADMVWIPIQRRFGPVSCSKLGLEVAGIGGQDPTLGLGFDGGITLGALDIELDQLTVGMHLKSFGAASTFDLDLRGLSVSYVSGSVELSAGLQKLVNADGTVSYNGEALLTAESLTLSAVGSFGSLADGSTSLFVFAWLDTPLGGPPFFYVTGLAAGFGYNRALRIPAQGEVQGFPLVAGVSDPALLGAAPAGPAPTPAPAPETALAALQAWVPPERGEYWLAAGVQFTTFEIVRTNALLVVEFGADLVVAVIGISTLQQPLAGVPWVYAELEVDVQFHPSEGTLTAAAVLAPSSYVLTRDAHLTGGFAFAAWFGANAHSGDFVVTLGGYYPGFAVPSHYPQEPRVGIDWQVSDEIVVAGSAYFAMTPAAMMAGGELRLTFDAGPLKAWLKADADVILFWHPFFLDAKVSISIGVSFHLHVLFVDVTLSVEIGVEFELWGPPIGFSAYVDWYVISFTIGGGEKAPPPPLGWSDFKQLLPVSARTDHAALGASATTPAYVTLTSSAGLLRTGVVKGVVHWLVRLRDFAFTAGCAFPPTSLESPAPQPLLQGADIAIRPIGLDTRAYVGPATITVVDLAEDDPDPTAPGTPAKITWAASSVERGVPKALWGTPVSGAAPPPDADAPTLTALTGATLATDQEPPAACTPEMTIDAVFADDVLDSPPAALPIGPGDQPLGTPPVARDSFAAIAAIASAEVAGRRATLFAALGGLGVNAGYDDPLTAMAGAPADSFADEPLEGVPA